MAPTSSHPNFIAKNIPFSLAYRLLRICSDPRDLTYHLRVLKQKLTMRGYRPKIISAAFKKIREIPRERALMKVSKTKVDRICLPIPYDPRFPHISHILHKHWKVLVQDPRMKEIFPSPPMVSYSRCKNLRDFLVRAKLPPPTTGFSLGR